MNDHIILITSANLKSKRELELVGEGSSGKSGARSSSTTSDGWSIDEIQFSDEEEGGYGPKVECRICQEEEYAVNLEAPCACSGSIKLDICFFDRKCIQQWCNEKKDTTCEICIQLYQPNFTAPPRSSPISNTLRSGDTTVDISGSWTVPNSPGDVESPPLGTDASADLVVDAEYDACTTANASMAGIVRSLVALFLILMLIRDAYKLAGTKEAENLCSIISVLVVRIVFIFVLPLYVLIWVGSFLHSRYQGNIEEAGGQLETSEVGIMLQAGQHRRGRQFSVGSESEESPHES